MADFFIAWGQNEWVEHTRNTLEPDSFVSETPIGNDRREIMFGFSPGPHPWPGAMSNGHRFLVVWLGGEARRKAARVGESRVRRILANNGVSGLYEVAGPLACCVFDKASGILHCIRDKIGRVPVRYYSPAGPRLVLTNYGAWMQAAMDQVSPNLNRLKQTLQGSFPEAPIEDVFEETFRVRPHEHVTWHGADDVERRYYWSPQTEPPDRGADGLGVELRAKLERAVDCIDPGEHFISMSGGVDSCFLAGLVAEGQPAGPDVLTASMVCRQSNILDERHQIVEVGREIPVEHHLFDVSEYWPFQNPDIYREFPADGPNTYALEGQEAAFAHWVTERLGGSGLVSGTGAEFCFAAPSSSVAIESLIRSGRWGTLVFESGLDGRRILKDLIRKPLGQLGLQDWVTSLYRTLRPRPPWAKMGGWTTCEVQTPDSRGDDEVALSPGQMKIKQLRGWVWEIHMRTQSRTGRRNGIVRLFPYLDERVVELALRLPWSAIIHKKILRQIASSTISEAIANRDYSQRMSSLLVKSLALEEYPRFRNMFSGSMLAKRNLVLEGEYKRALEQLRGRVQREGIDSPTSCYPLWLTIAAEDWLRTIKS